MLRTITKKAIQRDTFKNTDKSKWNSKKCPSNLQEERKNERNKREQIENKINKMEEVCPNI